MESSTREKINRKRNQQQALPPLPNNPSPSTGLMPEIKTASIIRKGFIMTNWKTTVSAALVLAGAIYLIVTGHEAEGGVLIPVAIGLFMAKDFNVTGGTKEQ